MSAPANRRRCSVKGCKVSDRDSESFSSHVAPKDDKLKAIWLEAIGRSRSDKRVQVCSRHFAPEVFELSTAHTERPRLRHGAVPTLFLPGATAATAASSLITGSTWPAPVPNRDSRVGSLSTARCCRCSAPRATVGTQTEADTAGSFIPMYLVLTSAASEKPGHAAWTTRGSGSVCDPSGKGGACSKEINSLSEPTTGILFKCCFCTHVAGDQRGILSHLVVHSNQHLERQQCPADSPSKEQDMRCNTEIDESGRTFECHLCPEAFQENSQLVNHIGMHTCEKPFRCQESSETFFLSSSLDSHIQVHTSKKSHKCQEFSEAFAQSDTLAIHMQTHTGKCSQTFDMRAALKAHI
ncbi:zinc finger protein 471-like isoform X1 [Ixodes scapularis]|nr:zinc finger protein 471-like isoform X1 [Ixodes scapularis]